MLVEKVGSEAGFKFGDTNSVTGSYALTHSGTDSTRVAVILVQTDLDSTALDARKNDAGGEAFRSSLSDQLPPWA